MRNAYLNDPTILHTETVNYGEAATYNEIPVYTAREGDLDAQFFLFNKWDKTTTYITGDTVVNAIWDTVKWSALAGNNKKDLSEYTSVELYAVASYAAS
jgi:hypothetical protein